ncbi:hypothetical protein BDQ17DRAFT_977502 [Cyathus striatus]|nr:hypothetical protein BDQ17DRAFT_977502 [Cyathus striatus]
MLKRYILLLGHRDEDIHICGVVLAFPLAIALPSIMLWYVFSHCPTSPLCYFLSPFIFILSLSLYILIHHLPVLPLITCASPSPLSQPFTSLSFPPNLDVTYSVQYSIHRFSAPSVFSFVPPLLYLLSSLLSPFRSSRYPLNTEFFTLFHHGDVTNSCRVSVDIIEYHHLHASSHAPSRST